jgi:hypothetical protein
MALKLAGDLVLLATIFFAAFVAFVRFAHIEAPGELDFLVEAGDWLTREFGPGWWALLLGLGAVVGWWVSGLGKAMVRKTEKHWDRR